MADGLQHDHQLQRLLDDTPLLRDRRGYLGGFRMQRAGRRFVQLCRAELRLHILPLLDQRHQPLVQVQREPFGCLQSVSSELVFRLLQPMSELVTRQAFIAGRPHKHLRRGSPFKVGLSLHPVRESSPTLRRTKRRLASPRSQRPAYSHNEKTTCTFQNGLSKMGRQANSPRTPPRPSVPQRQVLWRE